jgi:hypothetical protein
MLLLRGSIIFCTLCVDIRALLSQLVTCSAITASRQSIKISTTRLLTDALQPLLLYITIANVQDGEPGQPAGDRPDAGALGMLEDGEMVQVCAPLHIDAATAA